MRSLLFLTLASCAWAQVLLTPAERPRVFEIGKPAAASQGSVSDKKPVATAEVVPATPLPLLQAMADGWEVVEIAKAGEAMNDGFGRPGDAQAIAVVEGPARRQLTVMASHTKGVRLEDLPANKTVPPELIFENQDTEQGGVTRTVIDAASGKVIRQEMAVLGTKWNNAGVMSATGSFLSGESWDGKDRQHGKLFEVQPLGRGLDAAVTLPLPGQMSFKTLCTDEATQSIYLADTGGIVYRWKPALWKDLKLGGTLFALTVQNPDRALGEPELSLSSQKNYNAYWRELPSKIAGSVHDTAVAVGAARFPQIHSLAVRGSELWLSASLSRASNHSQLVILKGDKISLYSGGADAPQEPTALTLAPTGELLVADNHVPQRLVMLTREGAWKTLFRLNSENMSPASGILAVSVSPDGGWIFMYLGGATDIGLVGLRRAK